MIKGNGGPAFPQEWSTFEYEGDPAYSSKTRIYHHANGMSLRDWFAGQVLNGLVSSHEAIGPGKEELAYKMADAMLGERRKKDL